MRSNRLLLLVLLAGTSLLTACEPDKPDPPTAPTAAAPAPTAKNPSPPTAGEHQDLNRAVQAPLDKARSVEDQLMEGKEARDDEMEKQQN